MNDVSAKPPAPFNAAEIGALAHLYRAEVYRSTVWRTRLDATTNWAVVTTGLALSLTYSSETASPLPLVLVGLLVAVFLCIEARRYRFFDFWRVRAHILETQFFGPVLMGRGFNVDNGWNQVLHHDYLHPHLHIAFWDALGRRLRKNYSYIFSIQCLAYYGKLLIHPTSVDSFHALAQRATIGPVPGAIVLLAGLAFHGGWIALALITQRTGRGSKRRRQPSKDDTLELARTTA